jgi:hypothetical protein
VHAPGYVVDPHSEIPPLGHTWSPAGRWMAPFGPNWSDHSGRVAIATIQFRDQKVERETGVVVPSTKHPVEFSYRLAKPV